MPVRHNGNYDQDDRCDGGKDVVRGPVRLSAGLGRRQLTLTGSLGISHDDFSATYCRRLRMSNGHRVTILGKVQSEGDRSHPPSPNRSGICKESVGQLQPESLKQSLLPWAHNPSG